MLRNAEYIYNNVVITDEINSTKSYCKPAQVGVDLSARKVFKIKGPGTVRVDKSYVPKYEEIPLNFDFDGNPGVGWFLPKGTYIVDVNEGCQFGPNDTGYIIMRSSLNRSGVSINSAVWDPGFTTQSDDRINTFNIRLTVDNEEGFILEKNARIAQLVVWENENTTMYDGQYQGGRRTSKLVDGK